MVLGLRHVAARAGDGAGHPVLDFENGEELMHVQPEVAIVLGNTDPQSPGTLYISSKQLVWLSDVDIRKGYAVDFLSVSLHAISRDPESYQLPCIYTQIETEGISNEDEESGSSETECDENLELSKITEMRLVPSDPNHLNTLFNIFCECAELNPERDGEQDEEHNWVFGDDGLGYEIGGDSEWLVSEDIANPIGYSNGVTDHDLTLGILELQIEDHRFEDAEETECESRGSHAGQQ